MSQYDEIKELRNKIDDNYLLPHVILSKHMELSHNTTDEMILNEVIKQNGKRNNSIFYSNIVGDDAIKNAMFNQAKQIVDWLHEHTNDDLIIRCNTYSENHIDPKTGDSLPIGHGFKKENNQIKTYGTNDICIVLRKSDKTEYGFVLITAYPDIESKNAREIQMDLQPLLEKTTEYRHATPENRNRMLKMIGVSPKSASRFDFTKPIETTPTPQPISEKQHLSHEERVRDAENTFGNFSPNSPQNDTGYER